MPSLCTHVGHVLLLRSGAKVSRITAKPIITTVHNDDRSRQGSVDSLVNGTMRVGTYYSSHWQHMTKPERDLFCELLNAIDRRKSNGDGEEHV